MSEIIIRNASINDAKTILSIDNEYDFDQYSLDVIEASLNNELYLNMIANVDGKDVGYLSAMIVCDECELIKIVVRRNERRKGIGEKLLSNLKEFCVKNNIAIIFLEVREDNLLAKNLYIKNGFEKIGVRDKYYITVDGEMYRCKLYDKES